MVNIIVIADIGLLLSLGHLYDVTLEKAVDVYAPEQVHDLLANFPAVKIFIAHNSPRCIHERDTLNHQGFDAFLDYIDRAQPAYFLHGHQH